MEFKEVLNSRHATRMFTDTPIDVEKLKELITLCQKVPSWGNTQPWKVYIATGNTLSKIKEHHLMATQNQTPSNSVWTTPHRDEWDERATKNLEIWTNDLMSVLKGDITDFVNASANLFNSQAIAYLAIPKNSTPWTYFDLGGLSTSLVLTAKYLGIDSMPAYEFVKYPDVLREFLDVDPNYDIVMGIGLGYEDKEAVINQFHSERQPVDSFLTIRK